MLSKTTTPTQLKWMKDSLKILSGPQILSDLVQVIYQSGMKGWGVGGGGLKYSIILSVIPEGGEGGAQDHS